MVSFLKQVGLVTGGACLALAFPLAAKAQLIQPGFRMPGPIGLNQAAFNQAMTGQVHPGISPVSAFPFGNPLFNPIANPIANPLANPALNPALNPNAMANFFSPAAAFQANPLINPFTSPATNPIAAATLSASLTNPYASLTSSYGGAANPYSGYGSSY